MGDMSGSEIFRKSYDAGHANGTRDALHRVLEQMKADYLVAVGKYDYYQYCGISDCIKIVEQELEKM